MNSLGIYVHVPFCGKKCPYCDFYSVSYRKDSAEKYVSAVLRNIVHYADKNKTVDTLYFGGGTPSLLSSDQINRIISTVRDSFLLHENAEITLEANPNTLTPQKLSELLQCGVNRLSIGVQSMNDDELKLLGRTHTSEKAEQAVCDAHHAGFRNISCDLMIALPGQTSDKLLYSINRLCSLPVSHISAYILKAENGTPFGCEDFRRTLPDDDTSAALYLEMVNALHEHGFEQYEVSNFAKDGSESRHNCRYWKCLDYLGIGPSAHSCYDGKRFAVDRDVLQFMDSPVQQISVTDENPCGFEERAMLALRLKTGLDLTDVGQHRYDIEKKIPMLIKAGYAEFDGRFLSLTPMGFLMSNSVIEYLVF